jgi:FKBP-type peptidyl-prolyl cis-trans isomerase
LIHRKRIMNTGRIVVGILLAASLAACGKQEAATEEDAGVTGAEPEAAVADAPIESFEIAPGLTARILKKGYGRAAEAGDLADVHYTGWLFDETAADKRGSKFDSSVDRGDQFQFPLGAGRVIKGWDQGIVGMLIGEKRELTIAPEMAYGDRGAGGVIPPGATLVFEVELFSLTGPADGK